VGRATQGASGYSVVPKAQLFLTRARSWPQASVPVVPFWVTVDSRFDPTEVSVRVPSETMLPLAS